MSLRVDNLTYQTNGSSLVRGIDIEVTEGELVAILGPNGAGKSTLLKLLAGDLVPTTGTVSLDDKSVSEIPVHELALKRAFLSQDPRLELGFTVQGVVEMGRYPHRRREGNSAEEDRQQVNDALSRVEISHLAHRIVGSLSGGEKQRVSLARVIAQQTPILLMDEPTTFTDVCHQEMIMTEAKRIASAGGSVIAIIHDLNLAAAYADKILLLADGLAVAAGEPATVFTAETLTETYQLPMKVIEHPFRGGPLVLTAPREIPN